MDCRRDFRMSIKAKCLLSLLDRALKSESNIAELRLFLEDKPEASAHT